MNKWLEYLALIPKAMENPQQVIEGFRNKVKFERGTLPEDQQEEIVRRRLICEGCPFNSKNMKDYVTKRTDEHCTLCSCTLSGKTASLDSSCGAKTYNERHPEDLKPILWEQYIKK